MTMADVIDREVVDPEASAYTTLKGCKDLADVLLRLRGEPTPASGDDGADVALAALVAEIRNAARPDP